MKQGVPPRSLPAHPTAWLRSFTQLIPTIISLSFRFRWHEENPGLHEVHLISVDTISQDVCSGITNGSNGALGGRARRSNCPHIRDHSGRRALGMRDSRCSAPLTETWSSGKTKLLLSDRRALSTDRAAKGDRSGTAADGSPVEFNTGFIRASRVSAPSSILTNLLRLN